MGVRYPEYREETTTQLAAYLLSKHDRTMEYIKLLKLLYLIDRQALAEWGEPITFDRYYAMDNGPVLSQTYDRMKAPHDIEPETYWDRFISTSGYHAHLIKQGETGKLSEAILDLTDRIDDKFGKMEWGELIDRVCHRLPEWKDPHGSSVPITYSEILTALGKSPEDIQEIDNNLKDQAYIDFLFG